uniref:Uncharacterized protein n=1 Tax=Lactuca sativa TaxID=4236 RepID=A0A9R1XER3_LACSA|nr:hypothetical protein LSAT_V11C400202690 [Lactuca sativa]
MDNFIEDGGSPGPLLKRLTADAAAGGSLQKLAAGNTTIPPFSTIYGLVQCTPDLSEAQCILWLCPHHHRQSGFNHHQVTYVFLLS